MIGLGKLGQDCAEVMGQHYDVVGYDVAPRSPAFPIKKTIEEAVKDRDFIFIAAPTPHDPIYGGETPSSHLPNKDFDYTIVAEILREVNRHVNRSQLVVLISTVLPGTVRNILEPCITNARFIYNPYLIAMGTVKWDMVNPEMVIIGTEDGSLTGDASELIDFYKVFMQNDPRYEVGTWDEAEAIKIFYNTFISTKIALVNMIQDVAETNGNMNVDVVTQALANSTNRIMSPAYMKAGLGDAGACHPRDNIALRFLAERLDLGYDLFDSIMTAREVQAERMAVRCLQYGKNITIIGKAYKPQVPYTNGSASMLVGYYIEKHGGTVKYYDENTGDIDHDQHWTDVYLVGYWESYVESFIKQKAKQTATVIDPWRTINSEMYSGPIIHYGNTRNQNPQPIIVNKIQHIDTTEIENIPEPILQPIPENLNWDKVVMELKSSITIEYPKHIESDGQLYTVSLLDSIRKTGKHYYERALDWCSGNGILGFEVLGAGIAKQIVFADSYYVAVDSALENANKNHLGKYVTGHVAPSIKLLPDIERWDLVICNPPQYRSKQHYLNSKKNKDMDPVSFENTYRLYVDEDWELHKEFFTNINEKLLPGADIYMIDIVWEDSFIDWARQNKLLFRGKYPVDGVHGGSILHFKAIS